MTAGSDAPEPDEAARKRRAEAWRSWRDGEVVRPPALACELKRHFAKHFPDAPPEVLGRSARLIDDAVRGLCRQYVIVEVKRERNGGKERIDIIRSERRRWAVAADLRRLARAAQAKSAHMWSKVWVETPPDAIALLHEATGFRDIVDSCAVLYRGVLRTDDFLEVPAPAVIAALLPTAKELAAATRIRASGHRIGALIEIARCFEELTNELIQHPSHEIGSSRRSGPFLDFLATLQTFYDQRFKANGARRPPVLASSHSGSEMERIISNLRAEI